MDEANVSIDIDRPVDVVFKTYTEKMNEWWPRQGAKFRYTFAAPDVSPQDIILEPFEGGRYYEVFGNGEEYEIGRVLTYEPPQRIVYTWRAPHWTGDTTIEVTFSAVGDGTRVRVRHFGFAAAGVDVEEATSYAEGTQEVLEFFAKAVQAG